MDTLDVSIPLGVTGQPIKGTLKQTGRPSRVLYFSPGSLGRVLADLKTNEADLHEWWDLLGAAGVAAKKSGERTELVVASKAQVRDIRVSTRTGELRQSTTDYLPLKIHTPPLLWILTFQRDMMQSAKLFCTQRLINSLIEDCPLTVFPYAHGNTGSGVVCWGGVAINHITPKDPWLAERVFFASGTNDHLFHAPWLGACLQGWLQQHQRPEDLAEPIPLPWATAPKTTLQRAIGAPEE